MQHRKEEKKKVVITLCRVFPVSHPRAKQCTDFEKKLKQGSKIHTIRFNANDVWRKRFKDIENGEKYLSVREWTGRPYNSEQRELQRFDKIGMQYIKIKKGDDYAIVDNEKIPLEVIAKNDGLSLCDFNEWFFAKERGDVFSGVIIHFTKFRY